MKKRGISQVIEIMLFVLIGIILVVGLFIFIRFEINSRGEISEIMSNLADKKMDIISAKGDFENPKIVTLDLSMGAGEQTPFNYSISQYNYTVINMTANKTFVNVTVPVYWNETVEVKWNETIVTYWNETIETKWNETLMTPWNETVPVYWNETIVTYWNETVTTMVNGSGNYSTVSVADVSGSMERPEGEPVGPIDELKVATKSFIDLVLNNSGNDMGLVAYSDVVFDESTYDTYGYDWSQSLTKDKSALKSKVDLWYATYSTCICCGVYKATDYLSMSTNPKVMVVMSDGMANVDCSGSYYNYAKEDAIEAARDAFVNHQIRVFTIGFNTNEGFYGGQIDEDTLKEMARVGNGSYYYASVGELADIYKQIAETLTTVIEHVEYTIVPHVNYTTVEHVNYTIIEHVNYSEVEHTNYTIVQNINYTIVENTNYTIVEHVNYTTEVHEINAPVEVVVEEFQAQRFSYLKVVFYSDTDTYIEKIPFSELPGPLESKKLSVNLEGKITDVKRIEIYPVELTSSGKEVTGPLMAVWDVGSDVV